MVSYGGRNGVLRRLKWCLAETARGFRSDARRRSDHAACAANGACEIAHRSRHFSPAGWPNARASYLPQNAIVDGDVTSADDDVTSPAGQAAAAISGRQFGWESREPRPCASPRDTGVHERRPQFVLPFCVLSLAADLSPISRTFPERRKELDNGVSPRAALRVAAVRTALSLRPPRVLLSNRSR